MQVSTSVLTCIFLCPTSGTRGEARQEMPQGGGINRRQNSGQPLFSVRRAQAESPGGVTKMQVSTNVLACIFLCSTSGTRGVARQEMSQGGGINRRQNSGQPLFSVRRAQAESPGGVTKMQVSASVLTCIFLCPTSGTRGEARQEMPQSGKNYSDGNQIVIKNVINR